MDKELLARLKPLHDNVLLKITLPKMVGGVYLLKEVSYHLQNHGVPIAEVIAIGPEVRDVKVGDNVVVDHWTGAELDIEGEDEYVLYNRLAEKFIMGVVEEDVHRIS